MGKPIYVELDINAPIDDVWETTQNPKLHERWDLRFSQIDYLPKEHEDYVQTFHYETRIGFGLRIHGIGESVGSAEKESGEKVSALKFSSDQPLSLIKEGRGYWKYEQKEKHTRFLTRYDYDTRFGKAGKLLDVVFRPLMGWATAWSFAALKQWLEFGKRPEDSIRQSLLHVLFCVTLALLWAYQGIIPKLLFPETGELDLIAATGMVSGFESMVVTAIGLGQLLLAVLFLLPITKRWLFLLSAIAVAILGIGALLTSPYLFALPFNPGALTIVTIGVSIAAWVNSKQLVLARHCKRKEER